MQRCKIVCIFATSKQKQYIMILKTVILYLALFFSLLFVNYKVSTYIRAIVFKENEEEKFAIYSFMAMFLIALFWSIYFSCF